MTRAENRRAIREGIKAKTATYNLTKAQLDALISERINADLERIKMEATEEALNTAMVLLLALPLEVLMEDYWQKSYKKRIPEFTEKLLEKYSAWENDELSMEKLQQDLWDYAGIRLERAPKEE